MAKKGKEAGGLSEIFTRDFVVLATINLVPKAAEIDYLGHLCGFIIGFLMIFLFARAVMPRRLSM